jgi:hypothetical protein
MRGGVAIRYRSKQLRRAVGVYGDPRARDVFARAYHGLVRVGYHGESPGARERADGQKRLLGRTVTGERRRPRFDDAHARPIDLADAGGLAVDRGLHILPAEFVPWRGGGVDAEAVLGQEAPFAVISPIWSGAAINFSAMVAIECDA